jgi:hypothetical protein
MPSVNANHTYDQPWGPKGWCSWCKWKNSPQLYDNKILALHHLPREDWFKLVLASAGNSAKRRMQGESAANAPLPDLLHGEPRPGATTPWPGGFHGDAKWPSLQIIAQPRPDHLAQVYRKP